jgi:hypothetical protein
MSVRDQNWKPQSFTRDPQAHLEPVPRIFAAQADANYDMVTRWISLADQVLRNNSDACEEA